MEPISNSGIDVNSKPLPFGRRLAYAVGDFGSNFSWTFVASFAMFYLTDVVGLAAAVIGTLMLIARLLDGITDVVAGRLIDKTKTRMGKARPWLFWSMFPLAASQILLFNVPSGISQTLQYVYFFIVYLLLGSFFYTASNIAYNTLVSLVTRHKQSRVQMGSLRFVFAVLAALVLKAATLGIVDAFGGGARGWLLVAVLYSLVFVAFTLITVLGVKELNPDEYSIAHADGGTSESSFKQTLIRLLRNKYFLLMLGVFLVNYMAFGMTQGGGVYFATHVLGNSGTLGLLALAHTVPMALTLLIVPALTKRFGMRMVTTVGSALSVVGGLVALFNGGSLILLLSGISIYSAGMGPLAGCMYALLAEVAEYEQHKTGSAITGSVYAAASVGIKVGMGLGTAMIGWIIAAGGYDGLLESQPSGALTAITVMYLVVPLALVAIRTALLWFVRVESDNRSMRAADQAPLTHESVN